MAALGSRAGACQDHAFGGGGSCSGRYRPSASASLAGGSPSKRSAAPTAADARGAERRPQQRGWLAPPLRGPSASGWASCVVRPRSERGAAGRPPGDRAAVRAALPIGVGAQRGHRAPCRRARGSRGGLSPPIARGSWRGKAPGRSTSTTARREMPATTAWLLRSALSGTSRALVRPAASPKPHNALQHRVSGACRYMLEHSVSRLRSLDLMG